MIVKSGFFEIIPQCPMIGRIVFADGGKTQYLVTKRQALEIGESLVGISISEDEWCAIREQIHASDLLSKHAQLEESANRSQAQLSELKRMIDRARREIEKRLSESDWWKKDR